MTKSRVSNKPNAVQMSYAMLQSDAWQTLSGPAVKVFIAIACRYNGRNNGKLQLSLHEGAQLLGLGKSTVHRALRELEEKGFLVMTKNGSWRGRSATKFAVSTNWPRTQSR